jgi:hypothetical protein
MPPPGRDLLDHGSRLAWRYIATRNRIGAAVATPADNGVYDDAPLARYVVVPVHVPPVPLLISSPSVADVPDKLWAMGRGSLSPAAGRNVGWDVLRA